MAAIRRTVSPDTDMDQQTLLQQLLDGPARTTMPVSVGQPAAANDAGQAQQQDLQAPSPFATNPNTGVAGGMDTSISGPTGTITGGASGSAPAGSPQTNPGWDTDGYAAPAYTATGFGKALPGWDGTKWDNPDNQHPKYVVGRILSKYAPDDAGTQKAVQEIMQAYPGTTFDGKDKITVPGLGTIDFRTGAGAGGTGWQWDDLTNSGPTGTTSASAAGGPMTLMTPNGTAPNSAANALTDPSVYSKLVKYLEQALGPQAVDQNALLEQLAPQQ